MTLKTASGFVLAAVIAATPFTALAQGPGGPGGQGGPDGHHDQGQGNYVRHKDWKKGRRIPQNDWNRGARVDYRDHHLSAPPRGYEWREVDGNYVMAAVATGIIASAIVASTAH